MIFRRYIFPIFRSIYTALIFLALIFSALIWFFAAHIGSETWRPFDSDTNRWIAIGVLWFITLAILLTIFLIRRRREKAMTEEIVESVETGDDMIAGRAGKLAVTVSYVSHQLDWKLVPCLQLKTPE